MDSTRWERVFCCTATRVHRWLFPLLWHTTLVARAPDGPQFRSPVDKERGTGDRSCHFKHLHRKYERKAGRALRDLQYFANMAGALRKAGTSGSSQYSNIT